ncbi:protein MIX23 isoform X4 [Panulirus ornatus]|uniref:protein MIX23 isoform X4 n=1 Tax=Panulirus ornatus TaxID=150431 RepID=UPI003A89C76E
MMADTTQVSCEDISDTLRAMRSIDDKIIYELNLATPTQSFRNEVDPSTHCKELHEQGLLQCCAAFCNRDRVDSFEVRNNLMRQFCQLTVTQPQGHFSLSETRAVESSKLTMF